MGILSTLTGRDRLTAAAVANAPQLPGAGDALASWDAADDNPLTRVTLAELFGTAYMPVTRSVAMRVAPVSKGRHLICSKIASFPLVAMTGRDEAERPPAWVQQPEDGRPRYTTMQWITDALLFHGRAWLTVAERYHDGLPMRLQLVPEHNATVATDGQLVRAYGEPVKPADVIRIDGPHEGLLDIGRDTIRDALAIERAAGKAADNPVPSVDLHQTAGETLTGPEIDELIERWAAARRGQNGGVAYTNPSIEAKMHGASPEQLLIAGRNVAALNVARHMGLSAWAVDATVEGSTLTYETVTSRSRELVEYGLEPYMAAITARLSMDDVLPRGTWLKFETRALTRGSMKERAEGYQAMIDAGVYTAEECQAIEAGRPLKGK